MDPVRKSAIIVGVLFIVATVAGVLSAVFSEPLMDEKDYLTGLAANDVMLSAGALSLIVMAVAIALIPAAAFPVLRLYDQSLAIAYVVLRSLEAAMFLVLAAVMALLLVLSEEFVDAGSLADSNFSTLGTVLLGAVDAIDPISVIVFTLSALVLNYVLFRSGLVPQWLAIWGFVGGLLHLAAGVISIFATLEPFSTTTILLAAPIALSEMVLAVWLIVKGFNRDATVFRSEVRQAG